MKLQSVAVAVLVVAAQHASAKDCWALTGAKGQSAFSADGYAFTKDSIARPMILCFHDDGTGSVSGDDTRLTRFGESTLVGVSLNSGAELVESYQIDRIKGKFLFTKSRIGSASLLPGLPDFAGTFVGNAIKLTN